MLYTLINISGTFIIVLLLMKFISFPIVLIPIFVFCFCWGFFSRMFYDHFIGK